MIPEAREVDFPRSDRKVLEACCRSPRTMQRDLKRARIVLLAAAGVSTRSIAKEVGVQPRIVSLWRHRYADQGLEGLKDKPRPGKKPTLYEGDGQADIEAAGQAAARRVCALDRAAAGRGAGRCRRPICLAVPAAPQDRSFGAQVLVREQRSRICGRKPPMLSASM